jgi:hypothetical protein
MIGLEVAEEREQDALRQQRQNKREVAALAAADIELKAQNQERREREEVLAAN